MASLIGSILGALFITFILTFFIGKSLKKRMGKNNAVLLAALITAAACLIIASFTMGVARAAALYLPTTLIWMIVGLVRD